MQIKQANIKARGILTISVAMAAYHLYFATIGFLTEMNWRAGHLMFAAILIFLSKPLARKGSIWVFVDGLLIVLTMVTGFYIIFEYPNMSLRMGAPLVRDIVMGTISTLIVLEITQRTMGFPLLLISLTFLLYCLLGGFIPGIFGHRGFDYDRLMTQTYMTMEGIHGLPLGVIVKYVYFFVFFAGFLDATGAGKWFIDFAFALTGRTRSGPATHPLWPVQLKRPLPPVGRSYPPSWVPVLLLWLNGPASPTVISSWFPLSLRSYIFNSRYDGLGDDAG